MVTNFDSTEQKRAWRKLLAEAFQDEQNSPLAQSTVFENLWHKDHERRVCENLLNEHTQFATYFAGILRTAYLYCPQIMLTDVEVCDGVFFLALGPSTVNALLGKSYKDSPSITISGRADTFEECLFECTIATLDAAQNNAERNGIGAKRYTIKSMEYSIFNKFISKSETRSQTQRFYDDLAHRIEEWKNGSAKLPDVIAHAFASFFGKSDDCFAFLAQRWQEWLDAVACGQVRYENQNAPSIRERVLALRTANMKELTDFKKVFAEQAKKHANILKDYVANKQSQTSQPVNNSNSTEFNTTLNLIMEKNIRSTAFKTIEDSNLPDSPANDESPILTKKLLIDWYQFVYQRSLATHLGSYLIAVSAPENSYEQVAGQHMADASEQSPAQHDEQPNQHSDEEKPWRKAWAALTKRIMKPSSASLLLSGSITTILGDMPYHVFACFCYQSRSAIRAWRDCSPSTPARKQCRYTQNMAYLVQQASEEHSLHDDAKALGIKTVVAAVLAFISVLCDQVWFNNGSFPVGLAVLIAWLISIVPDFMELLQWGRSVRSSTKTVVFIGD